MLAAELVECARLVKGYGDTHARTSGQLHTILEHVEETPELPAERVAALREAALADDDGTAFRATLAARSAASDTAPAMSRAG